MLQVIGLFQRKYIDTLSDIYIEQCFWQNCSENNTIARTFYRRQLPQRVNVHENFTINSEAPSREENRGNYTLFRFHYQSLVVDSAGNGELLVPNISGNVIAAQKLQYIVCLLLISLSAILSIFVLEQNLRGIQKLIGGTARTVTDNKFLQKAADVMEVPSAFGKSSEETIDESVCAQLFRRALVSKELCQKFLPAEVYQRLKRKLLSEFENGEIKVEISAKPEQVAVVFVDLSGFTRLSENIAFSTLMRVLEMFYTAISVSAEKYGGIVSSFLGDGAMIIFAKNLEDDASDGEGAEPKDRQYENMLSSLNMSESASTRHPQITVSRVQADVTKRAASFILDINSAIENVQCENDVILRQIVSQLDVRAGAHCGQALLGVMGSQLRLTYTALGDVVNTASRIEQATRKLCVKALVSETMAQILQKHFLIREAGSVLAKGKTQELRVFQLGQAKDAELF